MEVRLLGPIEVVAGDGVPVALAGAKVRGILALLALQPGSVVPSPQLLDALWSEADDPTPNALQVAVAKLRRAFATIGERDRLVSRPAGYVLEIDAESVDALRFERIARDPARIDAALALWRGPAFADAPDTDTVRRLRTRFDELRHAAEETAVEVLLAAGDHNGAVVALTELVAAQPLREHRWALLMRARYGTGQQAEALRTYGRARAVLVEQVGVEPGPELRRLEAAVLAHDDVGVLGPSSAVPSVAAGFRRQGNLRHPVGTLIGRADEVRELSAAHAAHRLVTLIGPGGVGKTRLALELGAAVEPERPDGVWLVELAAARDGRDVVGAVHRALGLDDARPGDPDTAMADAVAVLTDTEAVLVFDNCEHVLDATASVVVELLERCRAVRVVATSREALGIPGELAYAVAPLAPDAAAALFGDRTSGLGLTEVDDTLVAGICERVDRLPLGIELAAGRARHLRLSELLDRLATPLALLDDGARAGSDRRSLRSVAEWSYLLLDEAERAAFEGLAVFADGATLGGAAAVVASQGVAPGDVESLLHRLVDKSLIQVDHSGGATRYRMLQTLSEYALEQVASRGVEPALRRAHARWVAELSATVAFGARTTGATVAAVLDEDVAIRDAIAWSATADPRLGLEIATALAPFWFGTMRVSTGWDLIAGALDAATDIGSGDRTSALAWAGLFATMAFDAPTASRFAAEIAATHAGLNDPERRGVVALTRALAAGYANDPDGQAWAARARDEFVLADHAIGVGWAAFGTGALHVVAGDPELAAADLDTAVETFRDQGDHLGLVLALSRLGELEWRVGAIDRFVAVHAEMLELGRSGRIPGVVAGATARMAMGRLAQGDVDGAEALARDALAASGGSFMPVVNGFAFRSAALVDVARGHAVDGRAGLVAAIDAFGRGAGQVGAGYATLCRIDLGRSFAATGDRAAARSIATEAAAAARDVGDPWVQAQAAALLAELGPGD